MYIFREEEVERKCKIFRNFESMTKKGHPKFWRMKRHILRGKSHGKVSLAKFVSTV